MGDGPGRGGSGATGGNDGGGLEKEPSGRESGELGPLEDRGTWLAGEDVSCEEGGIYVGGVGKDSRMRRTDGHLHVQIRYMLSGRQRQRRLSSSKGAVFHIRGQVHWKLLSLQRHGS